MTYSEVVILIPSHSLEDFPTELGDAPAAGLLNCFACSCHPALLALTSNFPGWHRADEPPEQFENRLYFVPETSGSQLPHGWKQRARDAGAVVVDGVPDRAKMLREALGPMLADGDDAAPLSDDASIATELDIDPELESDFLALGTCWILLELLTRHMHHFTSYDEVFFEKTAVAAAESLLDGRPDQVPERLQSCFDLMIEARERFYPVDCYLLDLCLLTPDQADEKLAAMLDDPVPVNLLLKGADAVAIAEAAPELVQKMATAWQAGTLDIAGGDYEELAVPLVPLESALRDSEKGRNTFQRLFGKEPTTWARRRYGLSTMQPQLVDRNGFHSALHFLLDDGIYPDREESRMKWEGCDSSLIDSYSRIPLAADSGATWLRFPQRLAETMESDQVAALILARWPEVTSPFYHDLKRIQKYTPVLGRFVTFSEFFTRTDDHGGYGYGYAGGDSKNYLSPFFIQAVARREADPIGRFTQHTQRVARFEAAEWQSQISSVLMGQPVDREPANETLDILEQAGPDAFEDGSETAREAIARAESALAAFSSTAEKKLRRIIMHGAGEQSGWLCVNPLSFPRRVIVDLPEGASPPNAVGPVKAVQFDDRRRQVLVEIPAAGFAWFPAGGADRSAQKTDPVLAQETRLRNEFFEVEISEATGGLQRLKLHGRSPNRLSQQLAYRFPREQVIRRQVDGEIEEVKTWYSTMRCQSVEVTSTGPSVGEIVTVGEIVDPNTDASICGFRQTFRVWRGLPYLELEIELEPQRLPDGDPWGTFYASRFAWNDSSAAISRSILGAAQPMQMERIETGDFIEIASSHEERTTILPLGLPFHRKTGPRMIDSILVCEGESTRRFRFVIAIDQHYPTQAARDVLSPVVAVPTETGPPRTGETGWFYSLDTHCIQASHLAGLLREPSLLDTPEDAATPPDTNGFSIRLQETEGRYQHVHVELFRTPSSGRVRNFRGQTISDAIPDGDGLRLDLSPFSIVDLEMRFD
jgi:alpha-mannosidase